MLLTRILIFGRGFMLLRIFFRQRAVTYRHIVVRRTVAIFIDDHRCSVFQSAQDHIYIRISADSFIIHADGCPKIRIVCNINRRTALTLEQDPLLVAFDLLVFLVVGKIITLTDTDYQIIYFTQILFYKVSIFMCYTPVCIIVLVKMIEHIGIIRLVRSKFPGIQQYRRKIQFAVLIRCDTLRRSIQAHIHPLSGRCFIVAVQVDLNLLAGKFSLQYIRNLPCLASADVRFAAACIFYAVNNRLRLCDFTHLHRCNRNRRR